MTWACHSSDTEDPADQWSLYVDGVSGDQSGLQHNHRDMKLVSVLRSLLRRLVSHFADTSLIGQLHNAQ